MCTFSIIFHETSSPDFNCNQKQASESMFWIVVERVIKNSTLILKRMFVRKELQNMLWCGGWEKRR